MRALRLHTLGESPSLAQIESPKPEKGEVLLKVHACGLNFADLLTIKGEYQERPTLPFTPGLEMAGRLVAVRPAPQAPAPGTRVAAFAGQGGLAEQAVVPAAALAVLPDSMPYDVAAGFQVAYGTSHVALKHRARLAEGETLLVTGAAGGVGLTAVELGRAMGARVIACARGADKLAVAKAAGAHEVIDSTKGDLRDQLKALGGVDVVYDTIGGEQFTAALRATRPEGRVIVIGFASGQVPPIPANIILVKNISVIGFYWGGYLKFAPRVLRDSMAELFAMFAAGKLHPHISHRFPLERAMDGFEALRSRASTGKVVITMTDQASQ